LSDSDSQAAMKALAGGGQTGPEQMPDVPAFEGT